MKDFRILWTFLSRQRRRQFWLIFLLIIISSLAEVVSIGAVLPFLSVLTTPNHVYEHHLIQPFIHFLGLTSPNQLLLPITIFFVIASIVAGMIRLALLYVMTRFSYSAGADLSVNVYRRTLYQNYSSHLKRNSSEVINGVVTKTDAVITGVMLPVLMLISSVVLLVALMTALLYVDKNIALISFSGFFILYVGIIRFSQKNLKINSKRIARESTQIIKSLQEGLGGIRDVLIDGSQEFYCKLYQTSDIPLRRALGNNNFISTSPRYAVESLGMSLIAVLAYYMSQRTGGMNTAIPILGALALGAQRILPTLQQIYSSISTIKGVGSSFDDVLELLNQPLPKHTSQSPIIFEKRINLNDIGFRYAKDMPWVFEHVNIEITKGSRVGFIGATGSGKSTLIDIIMALQKPSCGSLSVDNNRITTDNYRGWQAHIAHVPQNIFLADSSIEENIAFGVRKEEINHAHVKQAAERAQIAAFIEELPDCYKTQVGEGGVRLSGGQKQRIGIARALYKQSDVLIFDEATSALDGGTEKELMKAVDALDDDLTIIIIAHRLTTLRNCDKVVNLVNDTVRIGSYSELSIN